MDIIIVGSGIDLSIIAELIKNEKNVVLIIPEKEEELILDKELAVFPFCKFHHNFPVELLKITKPKLRTKRATEKVVAQNKTLSNHQKKFFKGRRK
ncbi:MAG: hypothetical protein Q7T50_03425 [Candidatus Magasanikbacteria bacterium]|nr:hypothetical protein [Candidatus Magasanikbacteria bacterium]